jgi:nucleoside-diphosphate-sugar epimerase
MNILITGGKGYIAQSLYSALKNEYNVISISRDNFDLTDSHSTHQFFENKYFDIIIHTAVIGGNRLSSDTEFVKFQNLKMWENIINNKSHFNRLIHFGSGAELYMLDTPYGLSKYLIAERIKEESNFTNLRIFAVFDKNELERRFITSNIKRYINKESIIIHQDKFMDFIFMEDLVSLIKFSILQPSVKLLDCCYEKKYKLSDIAKIINNLSDYQVPIEIQSEGLASSYIGNYEELEIKFIGLENSIKKTYHELNFILHNNF